MTGKRAIRGEAGATYVVPTDPRQTPDTRSPVSTPSSSVVSPSCPVGRVAAAEQRVGLGFGEELMDRRHVECHGPCTRLLRKHVVGQLD